MVIVHVFAFINYYNVELWISLIEWVEILSIGTIQNLIEKS